MAINLFGYMAPGSYAACRQADRYSAISFCEGVEWALNTDMRNATGVWYEDQNAFESRYLSNVNTVDMFIYSGHGIEAGAYEGQEPNLTPYSGGANLHWYARNSTNTYHLATDYWETYWEVNTSWDNLSAQGMGTSYLKWLCFYTCNFLKTTTDAYKDQMMDMFDGLHLACGFARVMYIEPYQGDWFGYALTDDMAIVEAWNVSSAIYQEPHDPTWTKCVGHYTCAYETIYDYENDPPAYIPNGQYGANEDDFLEWKYEV